MPDHKAQFNIKWKNGEGRLTWRYPFTDATAAAILGPVVAAAGEQPPNSITLGRYVWQGDDIAFIAAGSPLARASLTLDTVARRIARDLATLQQNRQPEQPAGTTSRAAQKQEEGPSKTYSITLREKLGQKAQRIGAGNRSRGIAAALRAHPEH